MTQDRKDHISITHGASGFFAIHVVWVKHEGNTAIDGYWDVEQSAPGRHRTMDAAIAEGMAWATKMNLEFRCALTQDSMLELSRIIDDWRAKNVKKSKKPKGTQP